MSYVRIEKPIPNTSVIVLDRPERVRAPAQAHRAVDQADPARAPQEVPVRTRRQESAVEPAQVRHGAAPRDTGGARP